MGYNLPAHSPIYMESCLKTKYFKFSVYLVTQRQCFEKHRVSLCVVISLFIGCLGTPLAVK